MAKVKARIRFEENERGEFFVYEIQDPQDKEWGIQTEFRVENDMVSYQAITTIREWMRSGVEFHFGK